jgi:cell division protease FtsH
MGPSSTFVLSAGKDVDLEKIAGLIIGFTGADLANLINDARMPPSPRPADVCFDDFTVAIERIFAGIEKKSSALSKDERRRVAYHEMGHALVAASLPGVNPVQIVSSLRGAITLDQ